jgi:hypothetical protein
MADGGAPDSVADAPVGDGGDNLDAAPGDGGDAAMATFNFCDKAKGNWGFWITTNRQTGANGIYRAVDGLTNTKWQTGHAMDGTEWFEIDFHGQVTMDGVTIDYVDPNDWGRGYKVYVSNDVAPAESDLVATLVEDAATTTVTSRTIPFTAGAATGRYLRVLQTGTASSWWSPVEISVTNCTVPAQTVPTWDGVVHDVSDRTNWKATAFNETTPVNYKPANMIDTGAGAATSAWQSGNAPNDGMWIALDLGAVANVNGIILTHANTTDLAVNLKVLVSIDGLNYTSPYAPDVDPGAGGIPGAITMDVTFAPNTQARYLRLINVGARASKWWSVSDLSPKL